MGRSMAVFVALNDTSNGSSFSPHGVQKCAKNKSDCISFVRRGIGLFACQRIELLLELNIQSYF